MGANHQKEIEHLCQIAEPDFGLITNFGKAHLEGFGGIEGIIKGKSELYNHLKNIINGYLLMKTMRFKSNKPKATKTSLDLALKIFQRLI